MWLKAFLGTNLGFSNKFVPPYLCANVGAEEGPEQASWWAMALSSEVSWAWRCLAAHAGGKQRVYGKVSPPMLCAYWSLWPESTMNTHAIYLVTSVTRAWALMLLLSSSLLCFGLCLSQPRLLLGTFVQTCLHGNLNYGLNWPWETEAETWDRPCAVTNVLEVVTSCRGTLQTSCDSTSKHCSKVYRRLTLLKLEPEVVTLLAWAQAFTFLNSSI